MMPSATAKLLALFSRTTHGLAFWLGVISGVLVPLPALAQQTQNQPILKLDISPGFARVAVELEKTLSGASTNSAIQNASTQVRAAKDPTAKAAAAAQVDAALGGAAAKLSAAAAATRTPGDKLKLGEMTVTYGGLVDDMSLRYQGFVQMLDSGVLLPQMTGPIQYLAGFAAWWTNDFANAVKYLELAKASGYQDPQQGLDRLLADSHRRNDLPPKR